MLSASDLVEYKIVAQDDDINLESGRGTGVYREKRRKWGPCRITLILFLIMFLMGFCILTLIPITKSTGSFDINNTSTIYKKPNSKEYLTDLKDIPSIKPTITPAITSPAENVKTTESLPTTISAVTSINEKKFTTDPEAILQKLFLTTRPLDVVVVPTNETSTPTTQPNNTTPTDTLFSSTAAIKSIDTKLTNISPTSTETIKPINNDSTSTISPISVVVELPKEVISEINPTLNDIHKTLSNDESPPDRNYIPQTNPSTEHIDISKETEGIRDYMDIFRPHKPLEKGYKDDITTRHVIWVMCVTIVGLFSMFACFLLCCIRRRRKPYYGIRNQTENTHLI